MKKLLFLLIISINSFAQIQEIQNQSIITASELNSNFEILRSALNLSNLDKGYSQIEIDALGSLIILKPVDGNDPEKDPITAQALNDNFNFLKTLRDNAQNFAACNTNNAPIFGYDLTDASSINGIGPDSCILTCNSPFIFSPEAKSCINCAIGEKDDGSGQCIPDSSFSLAVVHSSPEPIISTNEIDFGLGTAVTTNWGEIRFYNDFITKFNDYNDFTLAGYTIQLEAKCYIPEDDPSYDCEGYDAAYLDLFAPPFNANISNFGTNLEGVGINFIDLGEGPREFRLTISKPSESISDSFVYQVRRYTPRTQLEIRSEDGHIDIFAEQSYLSDNNFIEPPAYIKQGSTLRLGFNNATQYLDSDGYQFKQRASRIRMYNMNGTMNAFVPLPSEPDSTTRESRINYLPNGVTVSELGIHEFGIDNNAETGWAFLDFRFQSLNRFEHRYRDLLVYIGTSIPVSNFSFSPSLVNYDFTENNGNTYIAEESIDFSALTSSDPEGIVRIDIFDSEDDLRNNFAFGSNQPAACTFTGDFSSVNLRFQHNKLLPSNSYNEENGFCVLNMADENVHNFMIAATDSLGDITFETLEINFQQLRCDIIDNSTGLNINGDLFYTNDACSCNIGYIWNDTNKTCEVAPPGSLALNTDDIDLRVNSGENVNISWTVANLNTSIACTQNNLDSQDFYVDGTLNAGPITNETTFDLSCTGLNGIVYSDSLTIGLNLLCSDIVNSDGIGDYNDGGSCNCNSGYTWSGNSCNLEVLACSAQQVLDRGGNTNFALNYSGTYTILNNSQCRISSCQTNYQPSISGLSCEPRECSLSYLGDVNNSNGQVTSVSGTLTTDCSVTSCNSGYRISGDSNSCILDSFACTQNETNLNGWNTTLATSYSGTYSSGNYSQCQVSSCQTNYIPNNTTKNCEAILCSDNNDLTSTTNISDTSGVTSVTGDYVSGCDFTCDENLYTKNSTSDTQACSPISCSLSELGDIDNSNNQVVSVTGDLVNGCLVDSCNAGYEPAADQKSCSGLPLCTETQAILNGADTTNATAYTGFYEDSDVSQCKISSCSSDYNVSFDGLSCDIKQCTRTIDLYFSDGINNTNGVIPSSITGDYNTGCDYECDTTYYTKATSGSTACIAKQCTLTETGTVDMNNVISITGTLISGCQVASCEEGYEISSDYKSCNFVVRDIIGTLSAGIYLRNDGTVETWGSLAQGADTSVLSSPLTNVKTISSNAYAVAAVKNDGTVVTWGKIENGGDAYNERGGGSYSPILQTSDLTNVKKVYGADGGAFAALKNDGTVVTWGSYLYGGDIFGTTVASNPYLHELTPYMSPIPSQTIVTLSPSDATNVKEIYSTDWAFAALKNDGTVVTWGLWDEGGNSIIPQSFSGYGIRQASDLTNINKIYPSESSFAALKNDGTVITWGPADSGGDLTSNGNYYASIPNGSNSNIVDITAAGGGAFAALKSDNSLIVWGSSFAGGDPLNTALVSEPENVYLQASDLTNISKVYTNHLSFAALKNDGSVVAWGRWSNGGDPTGITNPTGNWPGSATRYVSIPSSYLQNVKEIYPVSQGYFALSTSNVLYAWGNWFLIHDMSASLPMSNVKKVVTGQNAVCILKFDNTAVAYNSNSSSTISFNNIKDIYEGGRNFCILVDTQDRIFTGGNNNFGGDIYGDYSSSSSVKYLTPYLIFD